MGKFNVATFTCTVVHMHIRIFIYQLPTGRNQMKCFLSFQRSQVISPPSTLTVGKSFEVEKFLTKETLHELCSQMELGFDTCAFKVFLRALIRKEVYHSKGYLRTKKQNNYTVMFKTEEKSGFGEIDFFLWIKSPDLEPLLLAKLTPHNKCTTDAPYTDNDEIEGYLKDIILPVEITDFHHLYINASDITEKCIAISTDLHKYFVKFPNDLSSID